MTGQDYRIVTFLVFGLPTLEDSLGKSMCHFFQIGLQMVEILGM
jgi:hypothetical protein